MKNTNKPSDNEREFHHKFSSLFQQIGFTFNDNSLLELAFTHCSYTGNAGENNQRLEYLGDAVLEFVVSERIYTQCKLDEGHMTRIRASIVCEQSLAQAARVFDLGQYLLLGKGEESTDGRDKNSILADSMESLIGAIFLDGGLDRAKGFIMQALGQRLDETIEDGGGSDYKTELQQLCNSRFSSAPEYRLISSKGPAHDKRFRIGAYVNGENMGEGVARTKKEAEQIAARQAIGRVKRIKKK